MRVARVFLAALFVTALVAAPAAAYFVSWEYGCYATYSDGIPVEDDQTMYDEVYADGSYIKTADYGNYGTAAYVVDLWNVTVSVSAHAHGVEYAPDRCASGRGDVETAAFQDRIVFTVQPGTYPDGAYATLRGRTIGSLGSTVGAGAQGRLMASFGTENYDTGLMYSDVEEATSIDLNETWELVLQLVAPGQTLNNPSVQDHLVNFGFYDGRAWSVSLNLGGGDYVTGDGDISFWDGMRITSLVATEGVTWVSDSGVFAGGLSSVPEVAGCALHQNVPNPFNPATTIGWELDEDGPVDLRVYDAAGRLVRTLVAGERRLAGPGAIRWDGRDEVGRAAASGMYFYRLRAGDTVVSRRMTLVR